MVNRYWPADPSNYTPGRTIPIDGIVIHHAASTSLDSVGQVFSTPNRQASAHYGVRADQVHQYVKEEDTAWHCGYWPGNCRTIGIETVNSTGAPDWLVSEATFNTLVKLVADIAKRNNLGRLKFEPDADWPNLSAHRDWSPTYCPGDYLYSRMNELADRANEINYPNPAKAELKWTPLKIATTYETTADPTPLQEFNHTHAESVVDIKDYAKGEKIDIFGKVQNKTIGKTYLLTEWSYTRGKTTGFEESNMKKVATSSPEPAGEPEAPKPTENPAQEETTDQRGLTDAEYEKVLEEIQGIAKAAKEQNVNIQMSNKAYDILKITAVIILPLINALYGGLSKIWGFGFGVEIDQTIQLVIAAINVILGAAIVKSSADYKKTADK